MAVLADHSDSLPTNKWSIIPPIHSVIDIIYLSEFI